MNQRAYPSHAIGNFNVITVAEERDALVKARHEIASLYLKSANLEFVDGADLKVALGEAGSHIDDLINDANEKIENMEDIW